MRKLIVAVASAAHLLPHSFGISPVGATAVYGAAYGRSRLFWLAPLVPLLLGNILFGFYEPLVWVFVYGGFALSSLAARLLLRNGRTVRSYSSAIVAGAVVFFLVSNFSVWLAGYYPQNVAGLVACYINGLPYLALALLVDSAYSLVFVSLHQMLDEQPLLPSRA